MDHSKVRGRFVGITSSISRPRLVAFSSFSQPIAVRLNEIVRCDNMARVDIECDYTCPHCNAGWTMGDLGIYVDDIEDESTTICDDCGGEFHLRCVAVDVEMEATKIEGEST